MYMISTPIHLSQPTGVAVGNGLVTSYPEDIGEPVPIPPDPAPVDADEGLPFVFVPFTAVEDGETPSVVPDAEPLLFPVPPPACPVDTAEPG